MIWNKKVFTVRLQCGSRLAQAEASAAFRAISYIGKRAELAMLAATGGVNTHKGAIFSLGLLCGAAGHSPDGAGGIVLLHLMARSEDTCLISRAGHACRNELRERLKRELAENPRPGADKRSLMDAEFIRNNCSSGGSADLLAMSWLLLFLSECQNRNGVF